MPTTRPIVLQIPTPAGDMIRTTLETDDVSVVLTLRWWEALRGWWADFATVDGDPIATGRRLCVGCDLIPDHSDPRMPSGLLVPVRTDGGAGDVVNHDDIGTTIELQYLEVA